MKTINEIRNELMTRKDRSAWDKGVTLYALELIEEWDGERVWAGSPADRKDLLNGAADWAQYSYDGCALVYDSDIAERLCTPSELKRTRNGDRNPNGRESWLDVQTRALSQAATRIARIGA